MHLAWLNFEKNESNVRKIFTTYIVLCIIHVLCIVCFSSHQHNFLSMASLESKRLRGMRAVVYHDSDIALTLYAQ